MTKTTPKENKKNALAKVFAPEETRALLLQQVHIPGDLDDALKRYGKALARHSRGNTKLTESARKDIESAVRSAMYALEVETHYGLMDSFDEKYRSMAKEMTSQIIKEYECTTHAEKMLVESVVSGFISQLSHTKRFNSCFNAQEYISSELAQFLGMLGKQIDRSNRQFLSSLAMLKQLKQPKVEVNIKANNAFVAENQQINHDTPES